MGKVFNQKEKRIVNLKFVSSLLFILIIVSCSEDKKEYIDGDDLIPPSPPFWEYFTEKGFDVDQDGVRDDLEYAVNNEFDEYNLRKALKEEYKVHTMFMNAQTSEEAIRLINEGWVRANCTLSFANYYKSKVSIEDVSNFQMLTLNNFWRRRYYREKFKLMIPKGVYSAGDLDPLKGLESCNFEVKDKANIIEFFKKR